VVPLHGDSELRLLLLTPQQRQNICCCPIAPIRWAGYAIYSLNLGLIPFYADNQGNIFIGSNPVQKIHTKHIDVKYHYVCECIAVKKIVLYHVPTKDNTADIFTKNLGCLKFEKFKQQLSIEFLQ
jgi:hypothetical protein